MHRVHVDLSTVDTGQCTVYMLISVLLILDSVLCTCISQCCWHMSMFSVHIDLNIVDSSQCYVLVLSCMGSHLCIS